MTWHRKPQHHEYVIGWVSVCVCVCAKMKMARMSRFLPKLCSLFFTLSYSIFGRLNMAQAKNRPKLIRKRKVGKSKLIFVCLTKGKKNWFSVLWQLKWFSMRKRHISKWNSDNLIDYLRWLRCFMRSPHFLMCTSGKPSACETISFFFRHRWIYNRIICDDIVGCRKIVKATEMKWDRIQAFRHSYKFVSNKQTEILSKTAAAWIMAWIFFPLFIRDFLRQSKENVRLFFCLFLCIHHNFPIGEHQNHNNNNGTTKTTPHPLCAI